MQPSRSRAGVALACSPLSTSGSAGDSSKSGQVVEVGHWKGEREHTAEHRGEGSGKKRFLTAGGTLKKPPAAAPVVWCGLLTLLGREAGSWDVANLTVQIAVPASTFLKSWICPWAGVNFAVSY